ncbi:MAG TPA: sensor domain-containing diguanylate cyclase [Candidatus Acidoferrum sp.]|nr:sensor domain-containing diguanylate cyclase [Candidatus Acidoferrum sp.]
MNRRNSHPVDDQQRLVALHALGLLDTPAEEKFDRITRLATRLFAVQAAVIVLADEQRLWVKSACGPFAAELTRDLGLLQYSMARQSPHQIADVPNGVRFAAGRMAYFYAAAPLHSREGHRLGLLCLADPYVRNMDANDLAALRDLAALIEEQLCTLELASLDALTGISNRRGFALLAQQNLSYCARQGFAGTLVLTDVAGLKAINDNHGRAEGDLILLMLADRLKKAFRGSDSYARVAPDQFAVFLVNINKAQARCVIERFAASVQHSQREAGRDYPLVCNSVFVEFAPEREVSLEMLMAQAEAELHLLKNPAVQQ